MLNNKLIKKINLSYSTVLSFFLLNYTGRLSYWFCRTKLKVYILILQYKYLIIIRYNFEK